MRGLEGGIDGVPLLAATQAMWEVQFRWERIREQWRNQVRPLPVNN